MLHRLTSAVTLIQRTTTEAPRQHMYYIGLDVHKKTISYRVKDVSGRIQQEGEVGSTRRELDCWLKALPQRASQWMGWAPWASAGRRSATLRTRSDLVFGLEHLRRSFSYDDKAPWCFRLLCVAMMEPSAMRRFLTP